MKLKQILWKAGYHAKKPRSQWKKKTVGSVFFLEWRMNHEIMEFSSDMFVGPNGIPQETGILG